MKLFLPKTLLAAIMACFALQAQAESTAININRDFPIPTDPDYGYFDYVARDSNLELSGDYRGGSFDSDDGYEMYGSITWSSSSSGSTYSLQGSGTLGGISLNAMLEGWEEEGSATFNIGSGITLHESYIYANRGTKVNFAGSIDGSKDAFSSFAVYAGGVIDISKATLGKGSISLDFFGGTIICDSYRVWGSNGVGGHGIFIQPAYGSDEAANTLSGNLTLAQGGWVEFAGAEYGYGSLHVNGTLTVQGAAQLLFEGIWDYNTPENPTLTSASPAVGKVLFTAKSLEGADQLGAVTLWAEEETSSYYDEEYGSYVTDSDFTKDLSDTIHLGYTFSDGVYQIKVLAGAYDPNGTPPLTEGVITGELSEEEGRHVYLSGTSEVDATGVTNLSNAYVKGDGGTLVTTSSQDMLLRGNATLGYDIVGDGTQAAARLIVGAEGGSINDAAIDLTGDTYESDTINVLSGQLNTAADTLLGTSDSVLTIGSDTASGTDDTASVNNLGTVAGDVVVKNLATMDNRGTIAGNVQLTDGAEFANNGTVNGLVTVETGARLQGSGSYQGVLVEQGGLMHIGNSPGYSSVADLTLDGGSILSFTVDGTTAATPNKAGDGTHSQLVVTQSLTLNGTATANVEITSGILAAGTTPFTLTLLQVDPTLVTDNGNTITAAITSGANLLEDGYTLNWDATAGALTLEGTVNTAAAAALLGSDGCAIANTLWSSTSAVRAFARTATSQLSTPPHTMGDYTVWGSALGDYVSMTGFRSQAHGYAVGMDKQFCPHVRTGLAFGQMFGDFTADRGVAEVEQESIMVGLYSEYLREIDKDNSISFTSYIAYGQTENDADTRVGGSTELPGSASWDDETFVMGSRAEWNIRVMEKTTLTPFIGLEYTHGKQDGFTESYAGGRRTYQGGSMQVWSLPVGVTARTEVALTDTQKLLPELTLAYVGDISRKNPHVRSTVYGISSSAEGTAPGRSGFMLNVGTQWLITEGWSAGAFYNLETRSHEVSQEASVSLRYTF